MFDERDTFSPFDEHPFRDELPERLLDLDAECAALEAVARDNERRVGELRPIGGLAAQVFQLLGAGREQRWATLTRTESPYAQLLARLEAGEAESARLRERAGAGLRSQLENAGRTETSWQARLRELGAISDPGRATDRLMGQLGRQVAASVRSTDSLLDGMRSRLDELRAAERRALLRAAPGKRGALRRRFRRARHELTVAQARAFFLTLAAGSGPEGLERTARSLRRILEQHDLSNRAEAEAALAWLEGTLAALADYDAPEARRAACQLERTRSRIARRPRRLPRARGSTRRRRPHLALTALQPHAPPPLTGAVVPSAWEGGC